MQIRDIYQKYRINTGLQEHMVRVASVAKLICDNHSQQLDTNTIVSACLLHDMGNLIKMKMDTAPGLFEPEGVAYWTNVQSEMIAAYGNDVFRATLAIIDDIGVLEKVRSVLAEASFEELLDVAASGSVEAKVLEYADMRVGLYGVVSLDARFDDAKKRYVPNKISKEDVERRRTATKRIEEELLSKATLGPDDITDASTAAIQSELWNWNIETTS